MEVALLPYQQIAMTSKASETLLLGGIGSGKTQCGALWTISKIAETPNCKILLGANTYAQLMNATVSTLVKTLEDLGIQYNAVLSGARKRIEIGGAVCYLYSLEKPDAIRGIEVDFAWLDECAFSTLKALNVVRGRMRGQNAGYRQMLLTTSGNGFNYIYEIYGNLDKSDESKQLIQARTDENIFLPDGYYEALVDSYGGLESPLAKQELLAQFTSLNEGSVYSLFERTQNVIPCQLSKDYPVYVGVDMNVDMMSAVYCQYIQGRLYICREVQLTHRNANTFDLAARICADLVGYSVQIIPDSTGRARKTSSSSGQTDHTILRDAGLTVLETSNPLIRDRQQSVNIAFKRDMLTIDPSCKQLIKDIETLSSRDKEGSHSHLGPAAGYCVWYLMPVKRKTQKARQIHL